MTTIREILVDWTTSAGGGKRSVLYFESGIAVATQRTAVHTWLTTVKGVLAPSTTYTVETAGRELDDVTGGLTGAWGESSAKTGTGTGTGATAADATQIVNRWRTVTIINGRFLRGRTFIPGVSAGNEVGGNLSSAALTLLQGAANTFIASGAGLIVWHRPGPGGPGSHDAVSTADVWTEFGVLRRRRG